MNAIIKTILGIIALLILLVVILAGVLFVDPTWLINPKNINSALKKTSYLKSWSWSKGEINHKWIKWNHRRFSGSFQNLCWEYSKVGIDASSCMEKVSWNLDLKWRYLEGFTFLTTEPLIIDSKKTTIKLSGSGGDGALPDFPGYWQKLFHPLFPDLDFNFRSIDLWQKGELTSFDLKLLKTAKTLSASAMNYKLTGTLNRITVLAPVKMLLPYKMNTKTPLYLNQLKLVADIEESKIPLKLTGKLDTANLNIQSEISRSELKDKKILKSDLLKSMLLRTTGTLEIDKVVRTIKRLIKPPFNILPAPLNVMEGSLKIKLQTFDSKIRNGVLVKLLTSLDMQGAGQFIIFDLASDFPFELTTNRIGQLTLGIDLKKILIRLPKLSKSRLPPQWKPDPRFIGVETIAENISEKRKIKKKKRKIDFKINLEAIGENALQFRTNLLDEALRLNLKLEIEGKTVQDGYIKIMPLKTTVFKRPIYISNLNIVFNAPLEPIISSIIEFRLPEYLITLKLVGPLGKPRHSFSSKPSLPQDDIIAVLLFGKPLNTLGPDDKTATKNANQIISQGILSLAVLYYLAGSPITSLGYDPDTKAVSAQFGLGSKSSLYVSSKTSRGGGNSYGVRRSLGKGWYIDSTVQKGSDALKGNESDYGLLLERIISY